MSLCVRMSVCPEYQASVFWAKQDTSGTQLYYCDRRFRSQKKKQTSAQSSYYGRSISVERVNFRVRGFHLVFVFFSRKNADLGFRSLQRKKEQTNKTTYKKETDTKHSGVFFVCLFYLLFFCLFLWYNLYFWFFIDICWFPVRWSMLHHNTNGFPQGYHSSPREIHLRPGTKPGITRNFEWFLHANLHPFATSGVNSFPQLQQELPQKRADPASDLPEMTQLFQIG